MQETGNIEINIATEANTGDDPKLAGWMRFYMTYILPLVVAAILIIDLVNFFGSSQNRHPGFTWDADKFS